MPNGDDNALRDKQIFEDLVFAVSPELFDLGPGGLRSTRQERLADRIKALSEEERGVLGRASEEIAALEAGFEELAPQVGEQRRRTLQARGFGRGPFAEAKVEEAITGLRTGLEREKQEVLTGTEREIAGRRRLARQEKREEERFELEKLTGLAEAAAAAEARRAADL